MILKSSGSDDQDTDVDVANNSDVDNSIDNDNNYYPLKCCLPQSPLLSGAKKQTCSIQWKEASLLNTMKKSMSSTSSIYE